MFLDADLNACGMHLRHTPVHNQKKKSVLLYCVYFPRHPVVPSQGTISSPVPTPRTGSLPNRGALSRCLATAPGTAASVPAPAPPRGRTGYKKRFPRKGGQAAVRVARSLSAEVSKPRPERLLAAWPDLTAPRPAAAASRRDATSSVGFRSCRAAPGEPRVPAGGSPLPFRAAAEEPGRARP